jgi:hypothetical protein
MPVFRIPAYPDPVSISTAVYTDPGAQSAALPWVMQFCILKRHFPFAAMAGRSGKIRLAFSSLAMSVITLCGTAIFDRHGWTG